MKIPNVLLFLMIAMLIGSIKLPSLDDKLHSDDTILDSLCSGERCTEPITDMRIGDFFFEAQNCVEAWAGFRDGCVLVFGNEGRRQKTAQRKAQFFERRHCSRHWWSARK